MPHPFAEAGGRFLASAKGWDSILYSSRASVRETSVRARVSLVPSKQSNKFLSLLPQARAQRSGARKKIEKDTPFISRPLLRKGTGHPLVSSDTEQRRDGWGTRQRILFI